LVSSQEPGYTANSYGYDDGMPGIPVPPHWNAEVAAGKAMAMLSKTGKGTLNIEGGSLYGVALAMPQFARTAGFSLKYTGLVIRAYFFLCLNLYLQGFLLYMISKEERIMARYGGQMHLCDYAAGIAACPDGPNCNGPGGTKFSSARLFNFELWSTRTYVRDAFISLFPERSDDINNYVDPGEYGLESYNLRIVCCIIFVIGCWSDLQSTINMFYLLRSIPSADEPWMTYEVPMWDSCKEHAKDVHGWSELNLVKFKVAGMPTRWKMVNYAFVWFPKLYIWLITVDAGIVFLLETAAIEEMIINAVALAFILGIDELLCTALVSPVSLYMTSNLEPFALFSISDEEDDTEKEAYDKHQLDKHWQFFHLLGYIVPNRLIMILLFTAVFVTKYYVEHCNRTDDGSWVSKPIHLPISEEFPFWAWILGPMPVISPLQVAPESVWSMPQ